MINYKPCKVALAIDITHYSKIKNALKDIVEDFGLDLSRTLRTPDNTYLCLYWECIEWYHIPEVKPLMEKLRTMRHSLVIYDYIEKTYTQDISDSDDLGCDEEFFELVNIDANLSFWWEDVPLARDGEYLPIGRTRLIELFRTYISNDYAKMSKPSALYEALDNAGLDNEEIEALGFGFCLPDDYIVVDSNFFRMSNEQWDLT